MRLDKLTIGELADRTGIATSALRYYDQLGLVRPVHRESGHRRYDPAAVAVVGVILLLREVGFTLKEIKRMVAGRSKAPDSWRSLTRRKLDELDDRIAHAQTARIALEHTLACPHENFLECPNFWKTVGGVLAGKSLHEAHSD